MFMVDGNKRGGGADFAYINLGVLFWGFFSRYKFV